MQMTKMGGCMFNFLPGQTNSFKTGICYFINKFVELRWKLQTSQFEITIMCLEISQFV